MSAGQRIEGPIRLPGGIGSRTSVLHGGDNPGHLEGDEFVREHYRAIPTLASVVGLSATAVILLLGQSNMEGAVAPTVYVPQTQGSDAVLGGVRELSQGLSLFPSGIHIPAPAGQTQMLRVPSQSGSIANGSVFDCSQACGKRFKAISGAEEVMVINRAIGGTGFDAGANTAWNPGDAAYEAIKAEVNAWMLANPQAEIVAIGWHQGETDAQENTSGAAYSAALQNLVADIRGTFVRASSAVFVCGTMHPFFLEDNVGTTAEIDAVHRDIRNLIPNSDVVVLDDFTDDGTPVTRPRVHYGEPGLRYFGETLAEYAYALLEGVERPQVPGCHLRFDAAAGEFRDVNGGGFRVFSGTYTGDELDIVSGTILNTDIPLARTAYTKIVRLRIDSPPGVGYEAQDLHILSGATPPQEFVVGTTPAGTSLGHWWTTRSNTHEAVNATAAPSTGLAQGVVTVLALTYDSARADGTRFMEYQDGVLQAQVVGNGQSLPLADLTVQIGGYGSNTGTAIWDGAVLDIITLPYAASAAEIAAVGAAL